MNTHSRPIKGVIFDAFGTLLQIQEPTHPYRYLLKLGIAQGRRPQPGDMRFLMTSGLDLKGVIHHLGITLNSTQKARFHELLTAEIFSIEPFQDGLEAIRMLQDAGLKVAVCSNLARPYGSSVEVLALDAHGLSFEVGAMKPDREIYQATVDQMSLDLADCVMIGDSQRCDRDGPAAFGIKGFYLDRKGQQGDFSELVSFAQHILANRDSGL